jgi:prepilin peptidase CpaA
VTSSVFSAEVAPLLVVCPLLVSVAINDLKYLRIPNAIVLASLVVFVFCVPLIGLPEAIMRLAVSAVVFAICVGLYAFRIMGGGDTKMIPAMFFFIPGDEALSYTIIFAWSLLGGIILVRLMRLRLQHENASWVSMRPNAEFPVGTAISLSGFAFLVYSVT